MTRKTPCVGNCVLDGDVCIGCGRTIAEITQAGYDSIGEDDCETEEEQAD